MSGLFFARFKKTQDRKNLAQKKTQGKFWQKTKGIGVNSIFQPKNSRSGTHFDRYMRLKLDFLDIFYLNLVKTRLFWQNIGKKLKAFGKNTQ